MRASSNRIATRQGKKDPCIQSRPNDDFDDEIVDSTQNATATTHSQDQFHEEPDEPKHDKPCRVLREVERKSFGETTSDDVAIFDFPNRVSMGEKRER